MAYNFALLGAGGYIAPRHMRAIRDTGNRLVAAGDPHDAVGVLDAYAFDVKFFTEIERFDRHLEKLKRGPAEGRVHWVSICTPNYLHDAHVRLALRVEANAICEKPLVISPWNLDALQELEAEYGRRVYNVLQLRLIPALQDPDDECPGTGPCSATCDGTGQCKNSTTETFTAIRVLSYRPSNRLFWMPGLTSQLPLYRTTA